MSKLKPCPFCGGEAKFHIYGRSCNVVCLRCQIGTRLEHIDEYEVAVDAWNTRAYYEDELSALPMTEENMREHGWVRERTCNLSKVTSWDDDGHNTWGVICSACDAHIEHNTGYGIRYCPQCGAKVVSE